ncbi:GCN5-related N-acetyltransferase 10, chloroplastic-like protein [Drosera capensis]
MAHMYQSHIIFTKRFQQLESSQRFITPIKPESKKPQSLSHNGERVSLAVVSDSQSTAEAAAAAIDVESDDEEMMVSRGGDDQVEGFGDECLVSEYGWIVRRMEAKVDSEIKQVAEIQAEAFHEPSVVFNDTLFWFFKAEVLSGLLYRLRNSPPDRYACLVAYSITEASSLRPQFVGVVDVTVLRDEDVLCHLEGAAEYLYVSGIAVSNSFRRQKVATVLLKACEMISLRWGHDYLVLRAHEDDMGARTLYENAGYRTVSGDPSWVSWVGRRRRILMFKRTGHSN